jgi:hypothetical protein
MTETVFVIDATLVLSVLWVEIMGLGYRLNAAVAYGRNKREVIDAADSMGKARATSGNPPLAS